MCFSLTFAALLAPFSINRGDGHVPILNSHTGHLYK